MEFNFNSQVKLDIPEKSCIAGYDLSERALGSKYVCGWVIDKKITGNRKKITIFSLCDNVKDGDSTYFEFTDLNEYFAQNEDAGGIVVTVDCSIPLASESSYSYEPLFYKFDKLKKGSFVIVECMYQKRGSEPFRIIDVASLPRDTDIRSNAYGQWQYIANYRLTISRLADIFDDHFKCYEDFTDSTSRYNISYTRERLYGKEEYTFFKWGVSKELLLEEQKKAEQQGGEVYIIFALGIPVSTIIK